MRSQWQRSGSGNVGAQPEDRRAREARESAAKRRGEVRPMGRVAKRRRRQTSARGATNTRGLWAVSAAQLEGELPPRCRRELRRASSCRSFFGQDEQTRLRVVLKSILRTLRSVTCPTPTQPPPMSVVFSLIKIPIDAFLLFTSISNAAVRRSTVEAYTHCTIGCFAPCPDRKAMDAEEQGVHRGRVSRACVHACPRRISYIAQYCTLCASS